MTLRRAGGSLRVLRVSLASFLVLSSLSCAPKAEERPRTLRIVFSQGPVCLDPQRHREDLTLAVLANFYEGLVDLDRNLQLRPRLALDWTTPSDKVWRFRLRRGVVFHDGTPFGAEDVVRTIERARSLADSKVDPDVRSIVAARALDDLTVELLTDGPRPLLLYRLAATAILPRSSADAAIVHPIGTGPYRFAGGAGRVLGERFEPYWGDRPAFAGFEIEAVTNDEERARAAAKGADLVWPLPAQAVDAQGHPRGPFRVLTHPTVTVTFLVCRVGRLRNGVTSPLADERVRRAISLGLDRETLVARGLSGRAQPIWQLSPPGVYGYVPEVGRAPADPAAARRLLAEAGRATEWATAVYVSPRGGPVGRELARQLANLGIRLDVVVKPWGELFAAMASGEAPLALASWTLATGDSSSLFAPVLHSRGGHSGLGDENTTGYASPELDAAIQEAAEASDRSRRGVLLAKMMRIALQDLPLIPLYSPFETYGVGKRISFAPRLDKAVYAADAGIEGR